MTDQPIRHAVVTGASSGIGRAIAGRLAADGTFVIALGRNGDRLERLATDAPAGLVRAVIVDLARADDLHRVGTALAGELQELDLLIHSAGAYARGSLAETAAADMDLQLAVNLTAPYRLTQFLLSALGRAQGQLAFINTSAVLRPQPMVSAYAASKAALRAMTDSLREEVNPLGIRVLSIYPGRTDTPLQAEIHELEGRAYDAARLLSPDDVASALLFAVHMPRSAEVTDIMLRPMRPPA